MVSAAFAATATCWRAASIIPRSRTSAAACASSSGLPPAASSLDGVEERFPVFTAGEIVLPAAFAGLLRGARVVAGLALPRPRFLVGENE